MFQIADGSNQIAKLGECALIPGKQSNVVSEFHGHASISIELDIELPIRATIKLRQLFHRLAFHWRNKRQLPLHAATLHAPGTLDHRFSQP